MLHEGETRYERTALIETKVVTHKLQRHKGDRGGGQLVPSAVILICLVFFGPLGYTNSLLVFELCYTKREREGRWRVCPLRRTVSSVFHICHVSLMPVRVSNELCRVYCPCFHFLTGLLV